MKKSKIKSPFHAWKRHHVGWWENKKTGACISKGFVVWWLHPKKGFASHHISLRAAQKEAMKQ